MQLYLLATATDLALPLAVLAIGFMFFGYKTQTGLFYLGAAALLLFLGFSFADNTLILLSMIASATILFLFTFFGGGKK